MIMNACLLFVTLCSLQIMENSGEGEDQVQRKHGRSSQPYCPAAAGSACMCVCVCIRVYLY